MDAPTVGDQDAENSPGGGMDSSKSPASKVHSGGEESNNEAPVDREGGLVKEYFPGHVEFDQKSGQANMSTRSDRFRALSVAHGGHELDTLPLMLVVFVCLVAALLGLVVAGLHTMVKYVGCPLGVNGCNSFSGSSYEGRSYFLINALDGYLPEDVVYVLMAMVTLLLIGLIVEWAPESYRKQALGGGTVQSLLAVAAGIPISFGSALLRVVVTAIYFLGGGTMGGDGPTIQVCTALAGMIGWIFGIRSRKTQSLLASLGFCCGFAASFNAPLAGILFAMEELQHVSSRLTTRVICIILIGSIVSTGVMRTFLGNKVLFEVGFHPGLSDLVSGASANKLFGENFWMLISIPIGLGSAIVGYVFHKCFDWLHRFLKHVLFRFFPRYVIFALLAGISAAIGSATFRLTGLRGVWGIGVQSFSKALNASSEVQENDALIFAIGKLAAFALGVAARFPGDTLEPVLISGGFLGAWVGRFVHIEEGRSACEIFGMVGLFASCFRFPLTPVLIVLELTGTDSYYLILPVTLSSFSALFLSNHLFPPILEQILQQDGIDLEAVAEFAESADDVEATLKTEFDDKGPMTPEREMASSHNSVWSGSSVRSFAAPSALQAALQQWEHRLEESMAEVSTVDHRGRRRMSRCSLASSLRSGSGGTGGPAAEKGHRRTSRLSRRSDESSCRATSRLSRRSDESSSRMREVLSSGSPSVASAQPKKMAQRARSSRISKSSRASGSSGFSAFGGYSSESGFSAFGGYSSESERNTSPVTASRVTFDENEDTPNSESIGERFNI